MLFFVMSKGNKKKSAALSLGIAAVLAASAIIFQLCIDYYFTDPQKRVQYKITAILEEIMNRQLTRHTLALNISFILENSILSGIHNLIQENYTIPYNTTEMVNQIQNQNNQMAELYKEHIALNNSLQENVSLENDLNSKFTYLKFIPMGLMFFSLFFQMNGYYKVFVNNKNKGKSYSKVKEHKKKKTIKE